MHIEIDHISIKKWSKTSTVCLLLSLYCIILGFSIPSDTYAYIQHQEQSEQKDRLSSSIYNDLVLHTPQSSNLFVELGNTSSSSFKLPFSGFGPTTYSIELRFISKYKQYQSLFKNILIRHRKSDLFFPFHNFW